MVRQSKSFTLDTSVSLGTRHKHGYDSVPVPWLLVATVVIAVGAVIPAAAHAALLETGAVSRRDISHCDRASRAALSRRLGSFDRHVLLELRSGNPRRRFEVGSKGVVEGEVLVTSHTASSLSVSNNVISESDFGGRDGTRPTSVVMLFENEPARTNRA